MLKHKKDKLKIVRPAPSYIEFMVLIVYMVLFGISIKKWLIDNLPGYLWTTLLAVVGITFLAWLLNKRNKSIAFTDDAISISYLLFPRNRNVSYKDVKGYKLVKTYTPYGVVYHIRLLTLRREYEFIRDVYTDYSRIQKLLKLHGVAYLGKHKISSRHKSFYLKLTIWGSILSLLLFVLTSLLKLAV